MMAWSVSAPHDVARTRRCLAPDRNAPVRSISRVDIPFRQDAHKEARDMRVTPQFSAVLLLATFVIVFTSPVRADTEQASPADVAAVRSYTLTSGFLEKWKAVAEDPKAPACNLTTLTLRSE